MGRFREVHGGLDFTYELPEGDNLQFLDVNLNMGEAHTCWMYRTRGEKGILPYDSAHTKLVKRSVASGCLSQALRKSCHHRVNEGLRRQIDRLEGSGFPKTLLVTVAEICLNKLKDNGKTKDRLEENKPVVALPYIHNISHRLKKVAAKHDVRVALSAPHKLKGLCQKVNKSGDQVRGEVRCQVQHRSKFVECVEGVVYKIPLSCGKSYISQTGRLREHKYACEQLQAPGNLAAHCSRCPCDALFGSTSILERSSERTKREIMEAFFMKSGKHGTCVSEPSVFLNKKEIDLLKKMPHHDE
ncbi:unnamed protein product [Ixodes persulcatus]